MGNRTVRRSETREDRGREQKFSRRGRARIVRKTHVRPGCLRFRFRCGIFAAPRPFGRDADILWPSGGCHPFAAQTGCGNEPEELQIGRLSGRSSP